jgi:hypothetical protein
MITVNFRVTGIYVGNTKKGEPGFLSVDVHDNPTVFDVMKAVSAKVKSNPSLGIEAFVFSPSNNTTDATISAIYVKFSAPPRRGKKTGIYALQDNATTNPLTTFQYYIYDENFRQLNNNGFSRKFTQQPDPGAEIRNGYTVIIRQISIMTEPVQSDYLESRIESLNATLNPQAAKK